MSIEEVHFLVEEPSMEAALRLIVPKLLGPIAFEIYAHTGKSVLLKRLPDRLHAYAGWLTERWRVVVVIDRDSDDCAALKTLLDTIATDAGLVVRTEATRDSFQIVNRIAVEELEAWYFGDWEAVRAAYPRVPATIPSKAAYRDPDRITGGTCEALGRILQQAGYFPGGLSKRELARSIAAHMDPARNRSHSFRKLRDVLIELRDA